MPQGGPSEGHEQIGLMPWLRRDRLPSTPYPNLELNPNSTLFPSGRFFATADEYQLLQPRAAIARISALIRSRGMYPRDAFRAFNYSHSGLLTCSELYGGLDWLGLMLTPDQIYSIVLFIDTDGDFLVSFDEFKKAFGSSNTDADGNERESLVEVRVARVRVGVEGLAGHECTRSRG